MKVLTRYVLRAHIGPFLFAFVALTGVILTNTLAKELAGLAGKGLSTRVLLEFFVLSLPANIALTLPMAVLVAVLYTFSQLAAENEITALKAGGVDLRRMLIPLFIAAAVIAAGMVWFNDRVLPESNFRWKQLMVDIGQTSPLLLLREQTMNPILTADGQSHYYLRAGEIDPTTSRMQDVAIYDVSSQQVGRTIYADSGAMALNAARTDLVLTLFDGTVREVNLEEPNAFQRADFQRQVMRMEGVGQRLERSEAQYRSDREMTVAMMQERIDTLRAELREIRARRDEAVAPSSGGPEMVERRVESLQKDIREFQVEVQKKYSIAAATLVFVLIGVPLAIRFPRGGIGMVIAVSLTIFALYYVGLIGGEALGDEGYVDPVVAMWAMNAIFTVLGLLGLARIGWEESSGRGGGWGNWPRWLRIERWRRGNS